MTKVSLLTKGKDHLSSRGVLHGVAASTSYRIGATHAVCGVVTETAELIQDGRAPDFFAVRVENSGLYTATSPAAELIGAWVKQVLDGKGLVTNTDSLLARADGRVVFYTRVVATVYIIDDDGCAFDVCLCAVVKALLDRPPRPLTRSRRPVDPRRRQRPLRGPPRDLQAPLSRDPRPVFVLARRVCRRAGAR